MRRRAESLSQQLDELMRQTPHNFYLFKDVKNTLIASCLGKFLNRMAYQDQAKTEKDEIFFSWIKGNINRKSLENLIKRIAENKVFFDHVIFSALDLNIDTNNLDADEKFTLVSKQIKKQISEHYEVIDRYKEILGDLDKRKATESNEKQKNGTIELIKKRSKITQKLTNRLNEAKSLVPKQAINHLLPLVEIY